MTYVCLLAFGLLAALNVVLARNILYPPALLCGVWVLSLVSVSLSGDTFYAISTETLMLYLAGAIAFSLGALVPDVRQTVAPGTTELRSHQVLDWLLLLLALLLPLYWYSITQTLGSESMFYAARVRAVEDAEYRDRGFGNLVLLSYFVALALHMENDGRFSRRWRAYTAILLSIAYGSLTGAKGFARIVLVLMFISAIRSGHVTWSSLAKTLIAFIALFSAGLAVINFAYLGLDVSLESARLIWLTIQNYWLGSFVAFDQVFHYPNDYEQTQHPSRFFLETANTFGATFEVPSVHAAYTEIGPEQNTNTYTIYFSFFPAFGWLGTLTAMAAFGAITTFVYKHARRGPLALAFGGSLAYATIFTIHSDKFLIGLNEHLKMLLFFWFVYYCWPAMLRVLVKSSAVHIGR